LSHRHRRRALLAGSAIASALLLPTYAVLAQQAASPSTATPTASAAKKADAEPKAQTPEIPKDYVDRIKEEGTKRSEVMKTVSYLTDVIGPRLTASPNMKRANEWTRDKMASWGLKNAHLEAWGPFGRGWTLKRFSLQIIEPQCIPVIAYPKAWSPGTNGVVTGDVVMMSAQNEADLEKYKGKLKGAVVLTAPARAVRAHFESPGRRFDDKDLLTWANADAPLPRAGRFGGPNAGRRQGGPGGPGAAGAQQNPVLNFARRRAQFLIEEGVALTVDPSFLGDGGTIFVASANVPPSGQATPGRRSAPWDKDAPKIIPQATMAVEHYNRLVRMIEQGEKLKATFDLAVEFHDADLMGYNTVAEIPGADLKDEVVMLGGHMDSWHSGTGATDNAAGVSVAMEAVRILQAAKLQPRRTIRVGLWSGEEQGLYGSRAYVKSHFGGYDDEPGSAVQAQLWGGQAPERKMKFKPEYETFSAYYNLDNGTGKVRGVYMEGNEAVRPIFRKWLAPFKDMGAVTLSAAPTGGTDHMSFDGIGLPGFQFLQDPVEYETRTHHSNQDVFDRLQPDDLQQASVIMATFIYNTAMRDEKMPRKPLPTPTPTPTTPPAARPTIAAAGN
jgi:carboxypeptidase Q